MATIDYRFCNYIKKVAHEQNYYHVAICAIMLLIMNKASYSIGVVTYHARFEEYFVPLIENLVRIFPDKEILCVINGHSDKTLQIRYLDRVTAFMRQFPNVRYLTYDVGQSLSKCWNQLIILSHTDKAVILGDDVFIGDFFREQLEENIDKYEMFLINRGFAHFVISKNAIRKIGWFDERLPRIGWEDTDYLFRMRMAGVPNPNVKILGSLDLSTDSDGSDWENDPNRPKTKYTHANEDFFKTKWHTKYYNPEIKNFKYVGDTPYNTFSPATDEGTPAFYDFIVLDTGNDIINAGTDYPKKTFRYYVQKTLFVLADLIVTFLRKVKHFLKKLRQAKPPI